MRRRRRRSPEYFVPDGSAKQVERLPWRRRRRRAGHTGADARLFCRGPLRWHGRPFRVNLQGELARELARPGTCPEPVRLSTANGPEPVRSSSNRSERSEEAHGKLREGAPGKLREGWPCHLKSAVDPSGRLRCGRTPAFRPPGKSAAEQFAFLENETPREPEVAQGPLSDPAALQRLFVPSRSICGPGCNSGSSGRPQRAGCAW